MALQLRDIGFRAFALTGGFDAWKAEGLPLEPLRRGDPAENAVLHQPM